MLTMIVHKKNKKNKTTAIFSQQSALNITKKGVMEEEGAATVSC